MDYIVGDLRAVARADPNALPRKCVARAGVVLDRIAGDRAIAVSDDAA